MDTVVPIPTQEAIAIDDLTIALLIVRRDYRIVIANKQTHIVFGYDAGELIGKHLDSLVPPQSREAHHKAAEDYWQNAYPKRLGIDRKLQGLKKDGTLIPVEIGLYPYKDTGNIMVLIIDINTFMQHAKNIASELNRLTNLLEKTAPEKK